jgi:hypothetical protein
VPKSYIFNAKTIDGEIQPNPVPFTLQCSKTIPIAIQIVRGWNANLCSVATRVFTIKYGDKVLGSNDFDTKEAFISYMDRQCGCCGESTTCFVTANDCFLTVNGCKLTI